MRERRKILRAAGSATVALMSMLTVSPAAASPILLAPPPAFPGQQDGVFVTNGSTLVEYIQLDETHESYFSQTTFKTPAGFTAATIYLTENGAATCTPDPAHLSLGNCSDGLTLQTDPVNKHIDISFVSDGADLNELTQFFDGTTIFRGVSTNVSFRPETGQWQDVSSLIGQKAGFALVQSDAGPDPEPEPISLSLFGAGLLGLAALRRRKASRLV